MNPHSPIVLSLLAVALAAGCPTEQPPVLDVDPTIELSEVIPTVATITWTLADDDVRAAAVEYGPFGGALAGLIPASVDGATASATLLGLKAETQYVFRIHETTGDRTATSGDHDLTTGPTPPGLLSMTSHHHGAGPTAGFVILPIVTFPSAVVIVDADGDPVWWHRPEAPDGREWTTLFIPRAIQAGDGSAIVYEASVGWEEGEQTVRQRLLYRVSMDGAEVQTTEVEGAHHDFTELPDGTLTLLVEDERDVDSEAVLGDELVELAPDGTTSGIWSVWDHATYDPEVEYDEGTGWSHANAVEYVPATDSYLVSLRNFDAIWEIDRQGGEVLRVIGGPDSDYALSDGDTALFDRQHGVTALEDTLLVFDNRWHDVGSRVVEYRLHDDTGLAELVWADTTEPIQYSIGFGDAHRLSSGNTLVAWSSLGLVEEVEPSGEPVWRLATELGGGIGYLHHVYSLY